GAARGSRRPPASSRRRGGRGKSDDTEDGAETGGRGARGRAKKKQSPVLLAITLGALLIAGGAAAWYLMGGAEDDAQENPEQAATTPGAAGATTTPAEQGGVLAAENPAPEGSAPAAVGTDLDGTEVAPEAGAGTAQGTPATPSAFGTAVDLSAIPAFGPDAGVDEAEWKRIRDLVATALDSGSGVAGSRAIRELGALGRPAFPAIVNAMLRLDYSTEQGYRDGDIAQRMLQEISAGRNFEWRYGIGPAEVSWNQRVVQKWAEVWDKAKDDPTYWLWWTKQEGDKSAPEGEEETIKIDEDALDALDGL
nr:hypothetical protein [Chloroflexota bacterium]